VTKLTYKTKLIFQNELDCKKLFQILEKERFAWNACSQMKFGHKIKNSIMELHKRFYHNFRKNQPNIPSQIIIAVQRSVLSAYRSVKSNNHLIQKPLLKKRLSLRLDKRMYSYKNGIFSIKSLEKRVKCSLYIYPKLQVLINQYKFCDPALFVKDKELWIALTFEIPELLHKQTKAIGCDLGIVNFASTSEGNLYQDKIFNARKRKLRFNKRKLQSNGSKSAKRKFKKLKHKERNINHNFCHHLANQILMDTKADTIVLENLKSLKVKKHKYQNKNRISQISMYELRRILTYKAHLYNKQVITVSPAYTSQIDHRTNKLDGKRIGGRYIGKDKQILHADINAACNIGLRSKLPCSISNYYVWQANVNSPIVNGSGL
jgi:IS605 OrfB family transposase